MNDPEMNDAFYRLSGALTGEPGLGRDLSAAYLARVRATPEAARLPQLLEVYLGIEQGGGDIEGQIKQSIMMDADLSPLARMLIILWYTSEIHSTAGTAGGTPEQYFQGLLWPAIRAHPPGLSGGYFGHWTYPPEN